MKVKNKIKIKLNGKKIQINNNETLNKLVKRLNLPLNKVALELIDLKDQWYELDFFEQSKWKTDYFGLTPEKFKNVIWDD